MSDLAPAPRFRDGPLGEALARPLGNAVIRLLAAWRAHPTPACAVSLVTLSEAYAASCTPIPRRGPTFTRYLASADHLLSLLLPAVTRCTEPTALARLAALREQAPEDPRVGPWLDAWRATRPYGSDAFAREVGTWRRARASIAVATAAGVGVPATAEDEELPADVAELVASLPRRRAALSLYRGARRTGGAADRAVLTDALLELGIPAAEVPLLVPLLLP